jgi:hypothetical protein
VINWPPKRKDVERQSVRQFLSSSVCNRASVIPTVKSGIKSVKDRVAESVIPNKYRQHGTTFYMARAWTRQTCTLFMYFSDHAVLHTSTWKKPIQLNSWGDTRPLWSSLFQRCSCTRSDNRSSRWWYLWFGTCGSEFFSKSLWFHVLAQYFAVSPTNENKIIAQNAQESY